MNAPLIRPVPAMAPGGRAASLQAALCAAIKRGEGAAPHDLIAWRRDVWNSRRRCAQRSKRRKS